MKLAGICEPDREEAGFSLLRVHVIAGRIAESGFSVIRYKIVVHLPNSQRPVGRWPASPFR
jgi:hypothetical protein